MTRAPLLIALLIATPISGQSVPAPVIDVHLHASAATAQGPPPLGLCAPGRELPVWDPTVPWPF